MVPTLVSTLAVDVRQAAMDLVATWPGAANPYTIMRPAVWLALRLLREGLHRVVQGALLNAGQVHGSHIPVRQQQAYLFDGSLQDCHTALRLGEVLQPLPGYGGSVR